jgi:glycosyltransferase involved in cell wall biosynthesis
MKRSVLVIAHNEAAHIGACLQSLVQQSVQPDEIVVVVHNSIDATEHLARRFAQQHHGVRVERLETPGRGPVYPRIRGFEIVANDVVACIDGDAVADPDWLKNLTEPLRHLRAAAVGGEVRFKRYRYGNLASFLFFQLGRINPLAHFYFWGANFACKRTAYQSVGGLAPLLTLRGQLGLHYWADDCYLSLALERAGSVEFAPHARVYAQPGASPDGLSRGLKENRDRRRLFEFFGLVGAGRRLREPRLSRY